MPTAQGLTSPPSGADVALEATACLSEGRWPGTGWDALPASQPGLTVTAPVACPMSATTGALRAAASVVIVPEAIVG
jgi:hypothetical protein